MPITRRILEFFSAGRRGIHPDQLSLFTDAAVPGAPTDAVAPFPVAEAALPPPRESPPPSLEQQARAHVFALWERARRQFRVDSRFVLSVDFELRGRTVGKAMRKGDALKVRLNRTALEQNWADMRDETIPHEIAHLICFARPKLGRGHDDGWRSVCLALGAKGGRCYSNDTYQLPKARRTWRYSYRLESGTEVSLSDRHHKQVRAGQHIFVRKTKEKIEPHHWMGARELI